MEKKLLNALTHCPLFNGISEQGLEQIVASTKHKIVTFDKKDIYILAGMPYRHVDIMVQGEMVARMVSLSGKSVEVIRLVAGNLIAPALIFSKDNLMPVSVERKQKHRAAHGESRLCGTNRHRCRVATQLHCHLV